MESSNAGTEVANVGTDKPTQPVVSPVPDLVTNVPASTASTATPTNVPPATAANTTPSGSASAEATSAPLKPQPPTTKPTPAVAVKAQSGATPTTNRATSLPSAASEASVKNRTSREDKIRKKDDKSVDHVLRALNSLNTSEEKLAAMCKKYADIFDEHRKLQLLQKQSEKRCSMLQREKEQLQAEQSKAILTRSRLENLCRELQRQNKAIKDESLLKIREEEEKRKEVSAKFQTTMNEITTLMQQNNDKNMKLRDDNIDMTTKLKNICEQYEIRQQQVERISKQMQLEQQLADAKLSKLKMEMAAEREVLLREKQQLLLELQQYQQRCTEFQATEVNLRNQISMYNDKYDEFQKALARSNDVFGGFKGEMEKAIGHRSSHPPARPAGSALSFRAYCFVDVTSVVQPMDQGIIQNLKQLYRRLLVEYILTEDSDALKIKLDILQASRMCKKAWDKEDDGEKANDIIAEAVSSVDSWEDVITDPAISF
ncbi:hypothetical protein J6590_036161 [Homalodisca vitripennis]|nr:hypothetical protein J6590_036161 [Homalodisca vitripennis]